MRVLLVSANYKPSVGGIERFVEILAHGLADRGHDVTVAACRLQGAPLRERDGAVEIVRIPASDVPREWLNVPYPLPLPLATLRTLRRLLRHADVVHVQDALYATSVAALPLARRAGVPSVLTQHVAFVPQSNVALDVAQALAIRTLGRVARLASAVTSVNPQVAVWARRTWRLAEVRTLPVGVPEALLRKDDRRAAREELSLADDAFVALFTGRDVPKKRLDVVLAAADPAYELVAVTDRKGDGAAGARLVPFMDPGRFSRLLAASDAFVLPSQAEGFPLALQEALLAGVPCVVTRQPGYERYLRDGDVLFVPPEPSAIREALRRLAGDPAERAALARAAGQVGRRSFGVDAFVEAYERLYRGLVARP